MLKKIVTFGLVTLSVAVVVLAASVFSAAAGQYSGYVKDIDTTSTSARVTLTDAGINNYSILYSENKNFENSERASSNSEVINIYGLKPNTTYYFKLDDASQRSRR